MSQFISATDLDRAPTPNELYEAALFVEDAAAVAYILFGTEMSEGDRDRVLGFLSTSLSVAGEVLALGLDPDSGTFSNPAKIKKAS